MNPIVEMFREAAEAKGRDRFSCPLDVWDLLLAIGTEFNWAPQGSAYVALPDAKYESPAERDYQPGDAKDLKQVSEEDARTWANALEAAILSPRLPELLKQRAPAAIPHDVLVNLMREFTEYCYGGAFVFSMKERRS